MNHLEGNCEGIDASVFSSDMLFDDKRRKMLKDYIGRWTRAIAAHERMPLDASVSEITEPSSEECSAHQKVFEDDACVGYATWYPQMGGYVGKAVALLSKSASEEAGGCFDVLVWHDGEFAFGDEDEKPRRLHHCDPAQFIRFGTDVASLSKQQP